MQPFNIKHVTKMADSMDDAAAKGPSAKKLFVGNISYRASDGVAISIQVVLPLTGLNHFLVLLCLV